MNDNVNDTKEIFSFHLVKLPFATLTRFLLTNRRNIDFAGLQHSEGFFTMNLGAPIASASRYNFNTLAFFAWWSDEARLNEFLQQSSWRFMASGWHVRMKLYKKWGEISQLRGVTINSSLAAPQGPVIAVTLARLKLLQTPRFIKWGKPVESQVRNHSGQTLALAAFQPPTTFSTFSIWKSETEMTNMVQGRSAQHDGESHKFAMQARDRRDFHHEFSTMRFVPVGEFGDWNSRSNYIASAEFF